MGITRVAVPYAVVGRGRVKTFTEELQLASLYVLADAKRGSRRLSSIAPVSYPLRLGRWEGGVVLIDLLGLSQTSLKTKGLPDVEAFIAELNKLSEDPDRILKVLSDGVELLKGTGGEVTGTIGGLLPRPDEAQLKALLDGAKAIEVEGPALFQPIMKEDEVEGVVKALNELKAGLERDRRRLEATERGLTDSVDIVSKVLAEEIQNIRDRNARRMERLDKLLEARRGRLGRALEKEVRAIRTAHGKQIKPLSNERTKARRSFSRLEKRLEKERAEGNRRGVREARRELEEIRKDEKRLSSDVKALEAKRDAEMNEARERSRLEVEKEENRVKEARAKAKDELAARQGVASRIAAEVRMVSRQITSLDRRKERELDSLLELRLETDHEEMEVHVPFYLFRFGDSAFGHHPPVEVADNRGLFSRLRRILAENPENRMAMLIRPRGLFTDVYIEKALTELRKGAALKGALDCGGEGLNLFGSRDAMDGMMAGLVAMRKEGWIGDGEYIKLNVGLVERLGDVDRP